MEFLNVIAAAVAAWVFGAVWYMALARPWMAASGIKVGPDGKPEGGTALPYILSIVAMLIVAGMMRHTFTTTGITTLGSGILGGLGIGLFFISPWIMINNAYGMRSFRLTLIDGGYATIGCAIMGAVLVLF